MEPAEDRIPTGVPIQVVAYKCNATNRKDDSTIKVSNFKQLRVLPGASGSDNEEVNAEVDYVFQNCGEGELMDRSAGSIVSACVEGVNSCILSIGATTTIRSEFTQGSTSDGMLGLAGAVLEQLFESLQEKDKNMNADARDGRKAKLYNYFIRITYFEFYEEVITDLLNPSSRHLSIAESNSRGIYVKNSQRIGPVKYVDDALDALKQGRAARNSSDNAHGKASEFTSTLFKIDLVQTNGNADQGQTTERSSLYIVDAPSTERLSRPAASVRLAEGPLLNKTLHAMDAVIKCLSRSKGSEFASYVDSNLTQLLRDPLGGNAITLAVLFISDNDMEGTKATLELGRMLRGAYNFPVVNNEMMQGLQRLKNTELIFLREEMKTLREENQAVASNDQDESVKAIHNLEGRLLKENIEKLRLKEEKEKLVRSMSEFRAKYQQIVESKAALQTQLIETEEEKLRVSKLLLDLQLENNGLMEKAEQDKYEVVTKLLNAENDILELEMREETKLQRVKELEEQVEKAVNEKKDLAMEFVSLKTNYMNLNATHEKEQAKIQQLGVEVLTLANQKKVLTAQTEELHKAEKDMKEQHVDLRQQIERLTTTEMELNDKLRTERELTEKLRSEKAKAELELKAAVVEFETKKLELDKNTHDFARERDTEIVSLKKNMENELKRVQHQRETQTEQIKKLEASIRQNERQVAELETALARKTEEEVQAAAENMKLTEQLELQEANYRTKLLKFLEYDQAATGLHPSGSSASLAVSETPSATRPESDPNGESMPSSDHRRPESAASNDTDSLDKMRQELTQNLVETYRVKERDLATAVDTYRRKNHELIRKNRLLYEKFRQVQYLLEDMCPGTAFPDLPEETEIHAGEVSELEAEIEKELEVLRQKLQVNQEELALQQEKNLLAAENFRIMTTQLQNKNIELTDTNIKLQNDRDRLENEVARISKRAPGEPDPDSIAFQQMKEMQQLLLSKMAELRSASADGDGDASLRLENDELRRKLREARSDGGSSNQSAELEDAERRCAELMAKYAMAEKELSTYKTHMTKHIEKLQAKIRSLEAQVAEAR